MTKKYDIIDELTKAIEKAAPVWTDHTIHGGISTELAMEAVYEIKTLREYINSLQFMRNVEKLLNDRN